MREVNAEIIVIDYPPHLKHKVIFDTFDCLESQQALLLVNDHDPVPLYYQFKSMHPDGFFYALYVRDGRTV